jgi:hypothetical protein
MEKTVEEGLVDLLLPCCRRGNCKWILWPTSPESGQRTLMWQVSCPGPVGKEWKHKDIKKNLSKQALLRSHSLSPLDPDPFVHSSAWGSTLSNFSIAMQFSLSLWVFISESPLSHKTWLLWILLVLVCLLFQGVSHEPCHGQGKDILFFPIRGSRNFYLAP